MYSTGRSRWHESPDASFWVTVKGPMYSGENFYEIPVVQGIFMVESMT